MPHHPEPREKRRPLSGARSAPTLQRRCACGGVAGPDGECEACKRKRLSGLLQKKAGDAPHSAAETAVPATVRQTLQSPGQPLDTGTRASLEPRFNRDFSDVRIHTGGLAAKSADDVNALAYTVGRNVVFAAGQYAPHSESGRALLAHELTHVAQQGGAAFNPNDALSVAPSSGALETEAEKAARDRATSPVGGKSTASLQRATDKPETGTQATESECSGWLADHESTSKRAAETYVRDELSGNHGAVKKVDCDMFTAEGAFACTVEFADGLKIRVFVRKDSIVVGVFPIKSMTPPADQPLCWYDFKCPGPNRELVLTKRKCQSAAKDPDSGSHKQGPMP